MNPIPDQTNGGFGWRWKPVDIVVLVIAFAIYWPLGFGVLAWKLWNDRQPIPQDLGQALQTGFERLQRGFREPVRLVLGRRPDRRRARPHRQRRLRRACPRGMGPHRGGPPEAGRRDRGVPRLPGGRALRRPRRLRALPPEPRPRLVLTNGLISMRRGGAASAPFVRRLLGRHRERLVAGVVRLGLGPHAQQVADGVDEVGAVHRVEMEVPHAAVEQVDDLLGRHRGGDQPAGRGVVVEPLEAVRQPAAARSPRSAPRSWRSGGSSAPARCPARSGCRSRAPRTRSRKRK